MTKHAPALDPRKRPRQARAEATCAAILEAAARILETEGRGALTTNRIAELAGVSVGSLYQYYPGREAILVALIRAMRRDMLVDLEAAQAEARGLPLEEAARALIRASLEHHLRRPALAQALEREEADLPLDAETAELKRRLRAVVAATLAEHDVQGAGAAATDIIALSHGLVAAAIQAGERDFAGLGHRLERAVLGYLRFPGG